MQIISGYKIAIDSLKIIFGITLITIGSNIKNLMNFLFKGEIIEDPNDFLINKITPHIRINSFSLTLFFACLLIFLSALEIYFLIGTLKRNRHSAIGFLVISIIWVPFEIFFISKFLIFSKIISIIVDIVIIIFFFRLLFHSKRYFKK